MLYHLLALLSDGTIVDEGLESLLVFALKHHFKQLPASLVIGFFSIDVEGLQVIYHSGIEGSQVL